MSEITKRNRKYLEEEKELAKNEADKKFSETYKKMTGLEDTIPYDYDFFKDDMDDNKARTASGHAKYQASKIMKNKGIYNMESDLDKQEAENLRKKNARFSGLKKLLRGE